MIYLEKNEIAEKIVRSKIRQEDDIRNLYNFKRDKRGCGERDEKERKKRKTRI